MKLTEAMPETKKQTNFHFAIMNEEKNLPETKVVIISH